MPRLAFRLLRRAGLLSRLRLTTRATVGGRGYRIPLLNGAGYGHLAPVETWMTQLLGHLLAGRTGTFVDVGANVGQTLLKVKAVAPDMPYVGFEPNVAAAHYVGKLAAVNALPDVTLLPVGLSETLGTVTLEAYGDSEVDPTASILPDFRPGSPRYGRQSALVLGKEALSLKPLTGDVSAVKVDVEGAELEVLRALRPLLADRHPPVVFELLPAYGPRHPDRIRRQEAVHALLSGLGYVVMEIRVGPAGELEGLHAVTAFEIHDDVERTNFLAAPQASAATLSRAFGGG